jgi:hypothetical protein
MDVSAANRRRKSLICRERAEARDSGKVQESNFFSTLLGLVGPGDFPVDVPLL